MVNESYRSDKKVISFYKGGGVYNWSSNYIFCLNLEGKCVSTVSSIWQYLDNSEIPNMESLWENDEEKNQMVLATKVGFNIYAYNKIVKRWLFNFDKDMGPHLIINHRYMDFFIAENCFFFLQNIFGKPVKKSKWFSVCKTM